MAITAQYILKRSLEVSGQYSMVNEGGAGPHYWDCSGYVGYCCGAPIGTRWFSTDVSSIKPKLLSLGFTEVTNSVKMGGGTDSGLIPGDILVRYATYDSGGARHSGHVVIYIGNGLARQSSPGTGCPTEKSVGALNATASNGGCFRPLGVALVEWKWG